MHALLAYDYTDRIRISGIAWICLQKNSLYEDIKDSQFYCNQPGKKDEAYRLKGHLSHNNYSAHTTNLTHH
jgi:hypothetical protein